MYNDNDINLYEQVIEKSRELFPHRYFLTTKFKNWELMDQLGKEMHQVALTDVRILARYSKSHIYPLIGCNYDRRRNAHYHTILLSENELNFDALNKFDDGRYMDIQKYDGRRHCLVYTTRKHIPFYQREVVHPRMNRGECRNNRCIHSRALQGYIPR